MLNFFKKISVYSLVLCGLFFSLSKVQAEDISASKNSICNLKRNPHRHCHCPTGATGPVGPVGPTATNSFGSCLSTQIIPLGSANTEIPMSENVVVGGGITHDGVGGFIVPVTGFYEISYGFSGEVSDDQVAFGGILSVYSVEQDTDFAAIVNQTPLQLGSSALIVRLEANDTVYLRNQIAPMVVAPRLSPGTGVYLKVVLLSVE